MAAGLGFKDFTTGEVLTAADVDGYLMQGVWVFASAAARDAAVTSPQEGNFAYLKDTNVTTYYTGSAWANLDTTGMTNPMTTTGDTIYSSSGSTPARLGIGTAGQVLTVNSGATAPEWKTPAAGLTFVGAQAWNNSAISLSNNTWTAMTYTNEDYDSDSFHSNSTNTSRMTIPTGKGGKYLVQTQMALNSVNMTGSRSLSIYKNGAQVKDFGNDSYGEYPIIFFNAVIEAAAGDYVEIYIRQSSGTTFSTDANGGQKVNWFAISYLGA
jgi:hypothetical protein